MSLERKATKYQDLVPTMQGQMVAALAISSCGCKCFPVMSVRNMLTALGIAGRERKTAAHKFRERLERASCLVWNRWEARSQEKMGRDLLSLPDHQLEDVLVQG